MKLKKIKVHLHLLQHKLRIAFAAFTNKTLLKIHVFGDSHSSFCFTSTIPATTHLERSLFRGTNHKNETLNVCFTIHWLGPMTMFRVARDGLKAVNLKSMNVQDGEIAVFVFGEIDVRCHIEKQSAVQGMKTEEIIDSLVAQYIQTIIENRKQFENLLCVVCSVVPPTDNSFNPKYPFYGSLKTRIAITKQLNHKLHEVCASNNIHVLDLYADHCTEQGDLSFAYSQGDVHISPQHNNHIKQKLIQLLKANLQRE